MVSTTDEQIEENKMASFAKRVAARFTHELVDWPRLIVLKDKHEDSYFLVADVEAVWRWALQVLQMRIDQGYITEPEDPKPVDEVPDDVIDKLPEAMKKKALSDKQSNKALMKRHAKYVEIWSDIQKALSEKNGALAFKILDDRKNAEYEWFSFEDVTIS